MRSILLCLSLSVLGISTQTFAQSAPSAPALAPSDMEPGASKGLDITLPSVKIPVKPGLTDTKGIDLSARYSPYYRTRRGQNGYSIGGSLGVEKQFNQDVVEDEAHRGASGSPFLSLRVDGFADIEDKKVQRLEINGPQVGIISYFSKNYDHTIGEAEFMSFELPEEIKKEYENLKQLERSIYDVRISFDDKVESLKRKLQSIGLANKYSSNEDVLYHDYRAANLSKELENEVEAVRAEESAARNERDRLIQKRRQSFYEADVALGKKIQALIKTSLRARGEDVYGMVYGFKKDVRSRASWCDISPNRLNCHRNVENVTPIERASNLDILNGKLKLRTIYAANRPEKPYSTFMAKGLFLEAVAKRFKDLGLLEYGVKLNLFDLGYHTTANIGGALVDFCVRAKTGFNIGKNEYQGKNSHVAFNSLLQGCAGVDLSSNIWLQDTLTAQFGVFNRNVKIEDKHQAQYFQHYAQVENELGIAKKFEGGSSLGVNWQFRHNYMSSAPINTSASLPAKGETMNGISVRATY